jgi:hypothetical protein
MACTPTVAWNTLHFADGVYLQVVCNFLDLTVIISLEMLTKKKNKCIKSDVMKPLEKWKLED